MLLKLMLCICFMHFVVVKADDANQNPEKSVSFIDCCPLVSVSDIDELSQLTEKCFKRGKFEFGSCEEISCFFKNLNALQDNGDIDKEALKELAKKKRPSDVYDVMADIIDGCFDKPAEVKSSDPPCKQYAILTCIVTSPPVACAESKIWNPLKLAGCDAMRKLIINKKS